MQILSSVSTLLQVVLFAAVLRPAAFDDYSVWVTGVLFAVGIAQSQGSERVLIGRRSVADGTLSAGVLALAVGASALASALYLGSPVLAVAAVGCVLLTRWDYVRIVDGAHRPWRLLAVDAAILLGQLAAVFVGHLVGVPGLGLTLCWWLPGALGWWLASRRVGLRAEHPVGAGGPVGKVTAVARSLRGGWGVLRADLRESGPLLADAVFAGAPLMLGLVLLRHFGTPGAAANARLAVSMLGPVTVIGLAVRRIVFARLTSDRVGLRVHLLWAGLMGVAVLGSAVLLGLSRTPLLHELLPGFGVLPWVAVVWFSFDRSSLMGSTLPAGLLRRQRRTAAVGTSRAVACGAALVAIALVWPVDSVSDVARCSATASIVFLACLYLGLTPRARMSAAGPGTEHRIPSPVPLPE